MRANFVHFLLFSVAAATCLLSGCSPRIKELQPTLVEPVRQPHALERYVNKQSGELVVRSSKGLICVVLPKYASGYDAVLVCYRAGGKNYSEDMEHHFSFPRNGAEEAISFVKKEYPSPEAAIQGELGFIP